LPLLTHMGNLQVWHSELRYQLAELDHARKSVCKGDATSTVPRPAMG
jgi:hypothetical protein